ncbi:MAG: hypothetical protein KGD63_10100 [Candidatus Lokiarchaeota archaeon]|nr:hypothetical protein [Candidatus Lokiarchaeota archaeon]
MIKKEDLRKSLEFFNDITLDEKDYDIIFDKFKKILGNSKFDELIKKKISMQDLNYGHNNIQKILGALIECLNIEEMNFFLQKIIGDEKLTTFIQDFFLEKLL